jgi:hypothetical protein
VGLLVSLAAHLIVKAPCLHWYLSDENIYYYMAHEIGWGHWPYQDFFYANPPLLLVLLKASGVLFGWTVYGLRIVPVGSLILGGILVYLATRKSLGILCLIPVWVYWWSHDALRASTHATGISETLLFIMGAYALAFRGAAIGSALFLALGLWTKTYAITAMPGLFLAIWLATDRDKRKGALAKFAVILSGSVILLVLLGTWVGGRAFWDMNLFYHLAKEPGEESSSVVFYQVIHRNQGSLYLFGLVTLLAAGMGFLGHHRSLARTEEDTSHGLDHLLFKLLGRPLPAIHGRFLRVGLIHFLTVFFFLIAQGRIFDFYLLLFLPALSFGLAGLLGIMRVSLESLSEGSSPPLWVRLFPGGCLALALVLLAQPMIPRQQRLFLREYVSYWDHEGRTLDILEQWKDQVQGPDSILSGDSGTAPLVALLAGTRLALGEADTNQMRFLGGFPPPAEFIRRLEESKVDFLVSRVKRAPKNRFYPRGMFSIKEFSDYAGAKFHPKSQIRIDNETDLILLSRKAVP